MQQWTFKICLLGEGAVGKTSLINKFVYDQYDDKYLKTIGTKVTKKVIDFPEHDARVTLTIFDILGQMVSEELQASYVRGSQGALFVCDLTNHETFDKLGNWIGVVERVSGSIPVIFLGNKCDLEDRIQITKEELDNLAGSLGGTSFFTSAKTGVNVEEIFRLLARKIAGLEDVREETMSSPEQVKEPVPQNQEDSRPLISSELFAKIQLPPKQKKKADKHIQKLKKVLDKEFKEGRFTAEECCALIEKKKIELGLMPPPRVAQPLPRAPPPPPEEIAKVPEPEILPEPAPEEPIESQPEVLPEPDVPINSPPEVQPEEPIQNSPEVQIESEPEKPIQSQSEVRWELQPEEPIQSTPPLEYEITEPVAVPPEVPERIEEEQPPAVEERKASAFFNVPVEAIGQLRERLEIILADRDKETVEGILVEYGFDCGSTAIKSMGITCHIEDLEKTLPDIWIGIGLSKVSVGNIQDGGIELSLYELEVDEPQFLGGCLAGAVSGLLGSRYKVKLNKIDNGYAILLEPGLSARIEPEEVPQEEAPTGESYILDSGTSYIIPEKALGFTVFQEKIAHNWKGICLTREYPPKLRENYGLHNTPIFWFTDAESDTEQVVKPSRLSFEMRREIMDFMNENQKGIILIHGLEYLISHLNFLEVLKWLQGLRDQAAITGTTLLVAVNPVSIDKQNFQNLILEFEPLTGKEDEIQ